MEYPIIFEIPKLTPGLTAQLLPLDRIEVVFYDLDVDLGLLFLAARNL